MHHQAASDGSGEGKELDPVAIAAKSVSHSFHYVWYDCHSYCIMCCYGIDAFLHSLI